MAVTTREYEIVDGNMNEVLSKLHDAIADLGWFEAQPYGYLTSFVNTPGCAVPSQKNRRYLVNPTNPTAPAGTGAVFDVFRTPVGTISAITLVTGGSGYNILGQTGCSSVGTTITVPSTAGINAGMIVTKIAGTGTLLANTTVLSITNGTTLVVDSTPSLALSAATLSFADMLTLAAADIGGSTRSIAVTANAGSVSINITNPADLANIYIGQIVRGTNIANLVTVTAITGTVVTVSRATLGAIAGNLTFSDEIAVTLTGNVNTNNISGTASGLTITNVASNLNIFVGGIVTLRSGTPYLSVSDSPVIVSAITGTGPYTVTLRNMENNFKGFVGTGAITFDVSTSAEIDWFAMDNFTAPQTYVWAVAKIKNSNDRLGCTFWHFFITMNTIYGNGLVLYIKPMTGFNPQTNIAQGVLNHDWLSAAGATSVVGSVLATTISSSMYVPLTLRTRQSAIDPNFATFSFFEGNNNRNPFFISKYDNTLQPWSLNDVFLSGAYEIVSNGVYNTLDAGLLFRTRIGGLPKRAAEAGYGNYNLAVGLVTQTTYFRTNSGSRLAAIPGAVYGDVALYSRQLGDIQTTNDTVIPVYKNIPISPYYLPVPYYLPDDFVLIEIPWRNPALRDTVTISGTEVYTVIQGAVNTTTYTALVLAVRTT